MKTTIEKITATDRKYISDCVRKNQPFVLQQAEGWEANRDKLIEQLLASNSDIVVLKDFHHSYGTNLAVPQQMKYSAYVNQIDEYKNDPDYCYKVIFDMQRSHPELAQFCINRFNPIGLQIKKHFSIMFWHAYKGMSSNLHFDGMDNFNLQLKGQKEFYIAPPGFDVYHAKGALTFSGHFSKVGNVFDKSNDVKFKDIEQLRKRFHKITLTAGEMLYIPYGWWHQVSSMDNNNINVTFWWSNILKKFQFPRQTNRTLLTLAYRTIKSKKF